MTTAVVIQARTGSQRLPGKVLKEVGGVPLLGLVVRRVAGVAADRIIVATSVRQQDDAVVEVAERFGADVVRGPEADVLGRFRDAIQAHGLDVVVRVTADCPLIDPALVNEVIAIQRETGADYASNVLPRTFPRGLDCEVVAASALLAAEAEATMPLEREHVTPFLYRRPERFALVAVTNDEDLSDLQWSVDTSEDLARARKYVAELPADFRWRDVLALDGVLAAPHQRRGLRLRRASRHDEQFLFELRNDEDAVRMSGSGRGIDVDEHHAWFLKRVADPGTQLWIAEVDGSAVGQLRVDVRSANGEISIAVAREGRGRGTGLAMLEALVHRSAANPQLDTLTALVHPENVPSLRLFERAGFTFERERGALREYRRAVR